MKVLSLFSGVGGFDLGFERAGMEIAGCCEIDPQAREILLRHFSATDIHDDITKLDAKPYKNSVDLVCGGFPCQDLSVVGRRAGLAGKRSGLFYEACRVIDECRPRWIVLENVPGLLSSNGGRDMLAVLQSLAELGYVGAYRVLDSQFFGVAQRRRRVFIVGHLAGLGAGRVARVLFEPESLRRGTPPSREEGQEVAGTLEARTGAGGFPDGAMSGHAVAGTVKPITGRPHGYQDAEFIYEATSFDAKGSANQVAYIEQTGPIRANSAPGVMHRAAAFDTLNTNSWMTVAGTLSANAGGLNRPAGNANETDFCIPVAMRGRADAYDLEAAEGAAHALRAGKAGMVAHSGPKPVGLHDVSKTLVSQPGRLEQDYIAYTMAVRRLTPVECERLQGFPDGWTDGLPKTPRYRMMGNAVTVNVAEWIGRRIMAADAIPFEV